MAEPLVIDVAGAQAALDAAGGMPDEMPAQAAQAQQARDAQTGQFAANTPAPAPTPAPAVPAAPEATTPPAAPADAPAAAEETDFGSFSDIDVNALTPEQAQMHRSLQADYTRKMQEAAPWRKLGAELGLDDPEQFRTAAEVYQRIQDPRNWPTIHGELTEYMQKYGMSPAEASQAASDQLMQFAPDTQQVPAQQPQQDWNDAEIDPGMAPLLQQMQAQQAQIKQLTDLVQGDRQQQQQQAQWNAVAQRLTSQENEIKALNPHYGDTEMSAIYSLMGPEGDLNAAQQRYESMIGGALSKYIASKGEAVTGAVPLPGGQVIATPAATEPLTREQGHAAAMAHVAALDRAEAAL